MIRNLLKKRSYRFDLHKNESDISSNKKGKMTIHKALVATTAKES